VLAPDGTPPAVAPHPYGPRVMIHAYVDHFFGPPSVADARRALRLYVEDRFGAARDAAQQLSGEDHARLMRFLDGDKPALAADLIRLTSDHQAEMAAVSPRGQLGALRTPTFLLHGVEDSVIPSLETRYLAREVPARALRRVLVTPVLGHADLSQTLPWRDYLALLRFVAEVLRAGERTTPR
jgi:pimeloyl-ACP methyl ester carboxylesterase